jgi:hypothetical protein
MHLEMQASPLLFLRIGVRKKVICVVCAGSQNCGSNFLWLFYHLYVYGVVLEILLGVMVPPLLEMIFGVYLDLF